MSPPPPYSSGKPMPVWPVPAISTTTSLTRSRKSRGVISSASSRICGVLDEVVAHQVADLGVAAVEQRPERGDVDLGFAVALPAGRVSSGRSTSLFSGSTVGISSASADLVGGHAPKVPLPVGSRR